MRATAKFPSLFVFSWAIVAGASGQADAAQVVAPSSLARVFESISTHAFDPLHLDPEMTGPEYRAIFKSLAEKGLFHRKAKDTLDPVLSMGQRNLAWLEKINAARAPDQRLELSTPQTQRGIPIDAVSKSNRTIVLDAFNTFKNEAPKAFLDVILGTGDLPATSPIDDASFLEAARRADRIYQNASRWLLQEPYLWAYSSRSSDDIRGYYFLSQEAGLQQKLHDFASLDQATHDKLSGWLVGQCRNAGQTPSACKSELSSSVSSKDVEKYFNKYQPEAKALYDSFFDIQNPRAEAQWSESSFVLPFTDPGSAEVAAWLKDNIEDEWKLGAWQLSLDFKPSQGDMAHVRFEAGATPHVNGLGASEITMDSNRSIQEYLSRWTIRHEFGHVLGFPDCYVEFYDTQEQVMVNYQIDIQNLMCARTGHLLPLHLEKLQHAYQR